MEKKKAAGASTWVDPDDAPELSDDFFRHAEIRIGDKVVRPGRPRKAAPKNAVSLRLDPDVIAHFRSSGRGWQSRINTALRKVAKLPKVKPKKG